MRFVSMFFFLTVLSCSHGQDSGIKLDLSGRRLNAVPDSVFVMTELEYLDLGSRNGVTIFPPLSALVDTNVNNIIQLPQGIGKLINLKTLILNSNKLDSLPTSIIQLTKLEELDLSLNKNLDILKELNKLKRLPNLKILGIVGIESMNERVLEVVEKELPDTKVISSFVGYFDRK